MCLMIYLLTDVPLPSEARVRGCSLFPMQPVPKWLAKQSDRTHATMVSTGGCGCGFLDDARNGAANRGLLAAVIRATVAADPGTELFAAWAGSETQAANRCSALEFDRLVESLPSFQDCFEGAPLVCQVVKRRG